MKKSYFAAIIVAVIALFLIFFSFKNEKRIGDSSLSGEAVTNSRQLSNHNSPNDHDSAGVPAVPTSNGPKPGVVTPDNPQEESEAGANAQKFDRAKDWFNLAGHSRADFNERGYPRVRVDRLVYDSISNWEIGSTTVITLGDDLSIRGEVLLSNRAEYRSVLGVRLGPESDSPSLHIEFDESRNLVHGFMHSGESSIMYTLSVAQDGSTIIEAVDTTSLIPDDEGLIPKSDERGRFKSSSIIPTINEEDEKPASAEANQRLEPEATLLSATLSLHSKPGASHVIYLDFDGHTTSGTIWNTSYNGGASFTTPAYSFEGDASFSTNELNRIQYIWERVSEDFIGFDVDITTEEPSADSLKKDNSGDTAWGVRAVIGGSYSDWYGSSAGGVAFVGSFNWNSDTPTYVFENNLGNGHEKYIAEAISHEVGHTLGLYHDGRNAPSEGYYSGHGSGATGWAPIMGVGYYQELAQWSKGEYTAANNLQDDLLIITTNNGFGYRSDDHGDTRETADVLAFSSGINVQDSGIIERNTDIDYFRFLTGAGTVNLVVTPYYRSPNLDILANVYDSSGSLIVSANPTNAINASISVSLSEGDYYLSVQGTGKDPLSSGYSSYGSIGFYSVTGTVVATGASPSPSPSASASSSVSPSTSSSTAASISPSQSVSPSSSSSVPPSASSSRSAFPSVSPSSSSSPSRSPSPSASVSPSASSSIDPSSSPSQSISASPSSSMSPSGSPSLEVSASPSPSASKSASPSSSPSSSESPSVSPSISGFASPSASASPDINSINRPKSPRSLRIRR